MTKAQLKKHLRFKHKVLTDTQVDLMLCVQTWMNNPQHRWSPSYRELCDCTGLTLAPVAYQVNRLAALGYLEKHGRRALIVLKEVQLTAEGLAE